MLLSERVRASAWTILPALAVAELLAHAVVRGRVPSRGDFSRAAAWVRAERRPGDLVAVAPAWLREPQVHLGGLLPIADAARADESRYGRVFEVAIRGAHADLDLPEGLWRHDPLKVKRFGPVTVSLYRLPPPATVRYDFRERLAEAQVSLVRGAERAACGWIPEPRPPGLLGRAGPFGRPIVQIRAGRFRCPLGEWNYVGETVFSDLRYRPRRCIWSHPVDQRRLRIEYAAVPLGRRIVVHTGLSYTAAREGVGVPVRLDVRVDGVLAGSTEHHDRDVWKSTPIATPTARGPSGANVAFEITSPAQGLRHFCWVADARD